MGGAAQWATSAQPRPGTTPLLLGGRFCHRASRKQEDLKDAHEKGDNGGLGVHRPVWRGGRDGGVDQAGNEEQRPRTAPQDRTLGCRLGPARHPAWPLPAEGAQDLRINQLSWEENPGNSSRWESSEGPSIPEGTLAAASGSTHLGKVMGGWRGAGSDSVVTNRIQILRACGYMCVVNTTRQLTNPNTRKTRGRMSNIYLLIRFAGHQLCSK